MGLISSLGKRPSRLHSSMMGMRFSSMNLRVLSRTSRSSPLSSVSNSMKSTPLNLIAMLMSRLQKIFAGGDRQLNLSGGEERGQTKRLGAGRCHETVPTKRLSSMQFVSRARRDPSQVKAFAQPGQGPPLCTGIALALAHHLLKPGGEQATNRTTFFRCEDTGLAQKTGVKLQRDICLHVGFYVQGILRAAQEIAQPRRPWNPRLCTLR